MTSAAFYGADKGIKKLWESVLPKKGGSNTVDNRLVNNLSFDNGERIATTKQKRNYKKQMQSKGIDVVVDKKGKVLTGNKAAGFDYTTGTIYIKKKAGVIDLLDNSSLFNEVELRNAESYITDLRRRIK